MTKKKNQRVKPLGLKLRKTPELVEGREYYCSFDGKKTEKCVLRKIETKFISVEFKNGASQLFPDEIGDTHDHAIQNTVTW